MPARSKIILPELVRLLIKSRAVLSVIVLLVLFLDGYILIAVHLSGIRTLLVLYGVVDADVPGLVALVSASTWPIVVAVDFVWRGVVVGERLIMRPIAWSFVWLRHFPVDDFVDQFLPPPHGLVLVIQR